MGRIWLPGSGSFWHFWIHQVDTDILVSNPDLKEDLDPLWDQDPFWDPDLNIFLNKFKIQQLCVCSQHHYILVLALNDVIFLRIRFFNEIWFLKMTQIFTGSIKWVGTPRSQSSFSMHISRSLKWTLIIQIKDLDLFPSTVCEWRVSHVSQTRVLKVNCMLAAASPFPRPFRYIPWLSSLTWRKKVAVSHNAIKLKLKCH